MAVRLVRVIQHPVRPLDGRMTNPPVGSAELSQFKMGLSPQAQPCASHVTASLLWK